MRKNKLKLISVLLFGVGMVKPYTQEALTASGGRIQEMEEWQLNNTLPDFTISPVPSCKP